MTADFYIVAIAVAVLLRPFYHLTWIFEPLSDLLYAAGWLATQSAARTAP